MKDSVPERIERKMSQRDGVPFMKGTPVFPRCRFSNVMQLPCHIGVKSAAQASLGFGRFRVLLRQRQLLADELPVELGTRAFDLLLALLESDGSLVTKEQLLARVWPRIAVAEDNVKVHISALRKALGEDRDFIRTEFGRGYRFTVAIRSTLTGSTCRRPMRRAPHSHQPPGRCRYWISSAVRTGGKP